LAGQLAATLNKALKGRTNDYPAGVPGFFAAMRIVFRGIPTGRRPRLGFIQP
jgi:hypothetical protein